ncbi:MAG: MOSC domain-containing protein [Pseudomonadota bacterium]|nr:MOSC domain-containing protein [Pseudomonadota bacterium]MEE3071310.1 MOSC domain-containing protein [Pseudomonadota bacterium]
MPALKPTAFTAKITWLGHVPDREAALASQPLEEMTLDFGGVATEAHAGVTRPSCSRVISQHPRDTTIANVRQLTIMSAEEQAQIAEEMGVDSFNPAWAGVSIVIEGIPDFTRVPPSSRLQSEDGTTIVIDMENRPCHLPAREIEKDAEGAGGKFKAAAKHRRGVTAWVERPGTLRIGDTVRLHIPDQPVWPHLEDALGD